MIELVEPEYAPWHPMSIAGDVKHIGKLGEESAELAQVACRCIIQGLYEVNPDDGMKNIDWLANEIADVEANIELVKQRFDLNRDTIRKRKFEKINKLAGWHKMA